MSGNPEAGTSVQELKTFPSETEWQNFEAKIIGVEKSGLRLSVSCVRFSEVKFSRVIHPQMLSDHDREEAEISRKETAEQSMLFDQIEAVVALKDQLVSVCVSPVGPRSTMLLRLNHNEESVVPWEEIAEDVARIIATTVKSFAEQNLDLVFMKFADRGIINQPINLRKSDD